MMDKRYIAALLLLLFVDIASAHADDSLTGLIDPTRPYSAGAMSSQSRGGLVLQSTLVSPRRRLAVINGHAFSVGERIGGAKIVAIRSYEVILSRAGKQNTLRLVPKLGIERQRDDDVPHAAIP